MAADAAKFWYIRRRLRLTTPRSFAGTPAIAVRSKAIIEARAKAKFKNWDDFMARRVVPADAAAAIKDVVSF